MCLVNNAVNRQQVSRCCRQGRQADYCFDGERGKSRNVWHGIVGVIMNDWSRGVGGKNHGPFRRDAWTDVRRTPEGFMWIRESECAEKPWIGQEEGSGKKNHFLGSPIAYAATRIVSVFWSTDAKYIIKKPVENMILTLNPGYFAPLNHILFHIRKSFHFIITS